MKIMKILVTGGLGFIGSNFILRLLERDDIEITNIDAELYGSEHKNLSKIKNSKKLIQKLYMVQFLDTDQKDHGKIYRVKIY